METEIWQSLPGVPGIEVSTFGRVRTLDRVISSEKMTRFTKGHILKQNGDGDGYLQVNVRVDGKWTMKLVHRLVAQTFIKNTDNLLQVNHRDCNPSNNCVSNLEWCTAKYNSRYREKYGISATEAKGHPVFVINLNTLEVSHFSSQGEASRVLGILQPSINKVIRGKLNKTGGYWFVNDDEKATDAIKNKLHKINKGGHYANTKRICSC